MLDEFSSYKNIMGIMAPFINKYMLDYSIRKAELESKWE